MKKINNYNDYKEGRDNKEPDDLKKKTPADEGRAKARKSGSGLRWKKVLWVVAMLAWVAVALLASQFVVSFLMIMILGDAVLLPVWTTLYSALVYTLTLFLVIFVPWRLFKLKTTREELGLSGLPTWTDLGLSIVGMVVYFILAMIVTGILMAILPNLDWQEAQNVGYENLSSWGDRVLAFVSLVVIAPIAEEVVFRGWLYGKFRSKMPAYLSIVLVSALFGLMHGQWNVGINVFCLSIVLCLLREVTGTIWSGIVLHMLKNGLAFYLLFVNQSYLMG